MVEYAMNLDSVFGALADMTRRDILTRVASTELSVSEIAQPYDVTLAAVSKHLKVLEKARLIVKRRRGRQQFVSLSPATLQDVHEYLSFYQNLVEQQYDSLENYLAKEV
jgi:DNA-binding transcriptional ArsR family regulator